MVGELGAERLVVNEELILTFSLPKKTVRRGDRGGVVSRGFLFLHGRPRLSFQKNYWKATLEQFRRLAGGGSRGENDCFLYWHLPCKTP